jgi:putative transposase
MASGARPAWWKQSGPRRRYRRPEIRRLTPVHVGVRFVKGTPKLRTRRFLRIVREALVAANEKFRFRVIEYSLQSNHLHMVAEAGDTYAVSRAMRGISISIAKRINAELGTRGVRVAERYFMKPLRTPLQTHLALRYVLNNYRRHAADWREFPRPDWVDPFSSGPWFTGWRGKPRSARDPCPEVARGTRPPRTILLTQHWKQYGLLDPSFVPGPWRA